MFIHGEWYCNVALQLVGVAFCVMPIRFRAQWLFCNASLEGPVAHDKTRISHSLLLQYLVLEFLVALNDDASKF